MSREFSRSRTHSPVDRNVQRILNLDSSPGSSRKHGEEGEEEGVNIPKFSKEISMDSEGHVLNEAVKSYILEEKATSSHLVAPREILKNISPKSILKRRAPEQNYTVGTTAIREKTKCCHPLVNKIKHLADKTLNKLERNDNEKSPNAKRKGNEELQQIRQLKSSPGAVRRQKFSAIKLGDSDEMSTMMCVETPPPRKKKEHIYEDIEYKKRNLEKNRQFVKSEGHHFVTTDDENKCNSNKESESLVEKKSNVSQDPSLVVEDNAFLKPQEHVMEKLHKKDDAGREALFLDEEMDPEEPNIDEIFQNQFDQSKDKNGSPNITITEIIDDKAELTKYNIVCVPIELSPSPSPRETERKRNESAFANNEWSKPSSDHEYEIIEKPSHKYDVSNAASETVEPDDEVSSTTSLERKYLQPALDDDERIEGRGIVSEGTSEDITNVEALQKDIEDRYFINTPSTVSRTECEVSTSQVNSSALENLPLKRGNRSKSKKSLDDKLQQRFKEGTGKIKTQADKLKNKIQNIKTLQFKMPERPKINLSSRLKFKMPEHSRTSMIERPKFDKHKFSLPDRPTFKKKNVTEKNIFGDRKKFTLPDRPKFNVPEFPKFRIPDYPKINFSSLGKKKEYRNETNIESCTDLRNVAIGDFETKTFPRLFSRINKSVMPKTSSFPTLNREDTPPATFTFTRVKKVTTESKYIPDSPKQPREYGNIDNELGDEKHFETTYDFENKTKASKFEKTCNAASIPDKSPSNQEYTYVINEINNDEFFIRPRGISRENIQVREYLSDEIRQAFKIPKNVLALMESKLGVNDDDMYVNKPDEDPELMLDHNNQNLYFTEDLNDRDDGYYTFPPVRPSRVKRKKTDSEHEHTNTQYIDHSLNTSMQFNEVDSRMLVEQVNNEPPNEYFESNEPVQLDLTYAPDLHYIHEFVNDDFIEYPDNVPVQLQTLPTPPKRKKKLNMTESTHSSLTDIKAPHTAWEETCEAVDDIIVYCTEHEYIVPQAETTTITEQSPIPPRRNRSRSSRGTSLCDDDRTSHGAESLTLDTNVLPADEIQTEKENRGDTPGYATVDKNLYATSKSARWSKSKTPPVRRRKSNAERKYYTVGSFKALPDRPPRKKSSTSLMTFDSFSKRSVSVDSTQYVEIDEPPIREVHKYPNSGDFFSKMKDRPLPPPPRPPRGPKREKQNIVENSQHQVYESEIIPERLVENNVRNQTAFDDVVETEVSTQTDPVPDDVDYELGMEEILDLSMSSSLRNIIDDDDKYHNKTIESPRLSRPTSRSEKSLKLSDPKKSGLSNSTVGRTSPTVILVEKRVSSPTRINEREEMLTEASLTVQQIDIDESQIQDVLPLPKPKNLTSVEGKRNINIMHSNEQALKRLSETASRDVQLDNLITQRLQVRDLDVGRLNVSEIQASKVLVSDIEGLTLQVAELDSKSSHIALSGIEFPQSVVDNIVKKFAEITTNHIHEASDHQRPLSREEQTQTDEISIELKPGNKILQKDVKTQSTVSTSKSDERTLSSPQRSGDQVLPPPPPPRPPPPDFSPLYSYLQDVSSFPASFYGTRPLRERHFTEFHELQHHSSTTTSRRPKRKPAAPPSQSSSDDERPRPSPRRMPPPVRGYEPTIAEAGAQFLRVCHNCITRAFRNIFNSFMSNINGVEDKKDVQMALVIFLVLIAGLIMFGISDSRTIHHHHWDFLNPPDSKQ